MIKREVKTRNSLLIITDIIATYHKKIVTMRAHLHAVTATSLQHHYDVTLKSIPCILVCTVTPGRSDVKWVAKPFGSDVAAMSLDVHGS